MAALFSKETGTSAPTATPSLVRSVHEARRLRQVEEIDSALAALAGIDLTRAETHQAQWAFSE